MDVYECERYERFQHVQIWTDSIFKLFLSETDRQTTWLHPKTGQPVSIMIIPPIEGKKNKQTKTNFYQQKREIFVYYYLPFFFVIVSPTFIIFIINIDIAI